MGGQWLIYGAYGYTGMLAAREAQARAQRPILAGRDGERVSALAATLGLEARSGALDDAAALDALLSGVDVVLHCAGPFSRTAVPMAEACLRNKTHYIDVTGEIDVFQALSTFDGQAKEEGVMLLPGAGCDVVPTDCLALSLKEQLPSASRLRLGLHATFAPSHGTAVTVLENLHKGGMVLRDGRLTPVPSGWKERRIDFGERVLTAITIPWGDVFTASWSTGIPNIEVYMAMPLKRRILTHALRYCGGLLSSEAVLGFLKRHIRPGGPSDAAREAGYCLFWGEAEDDEGRRVEGRLRTPDGYTLTVLTALHIVEKVLSGHAVPGYQTPASAYGSGLILEVKDVARIE